jgi:hypothetical protein
MIKSLLLALVLWGSPPKEHSHCWHLSPDQHAVSGVHSDWLCCHCGKRECRSKSLNPEDMCRGHGKYAPGCFGVTTKP